MVKMGEKLNNADGQTFEQSLEELETILSELENSKVPLDKLVEKYSREAAAASPVESAYSDRGESLE